MPQAKYRRDEKKPTTNLRSLTPLKKDGKFDSKSYPGRNTHRNKFLILERIIEMRVKGETLEKTLTTVSEEFGLARNTTGVYIQQAFEDIKKQVATMIEEIMVEHTQRYEYLYKWFHENGFDFEAMQVLFYKERLHGLHSEMQSIEINRIFLDPEEGQTVYYDIQRLDSSQQQRLSELLTKMSK